MDQSVNLHGGDCGATESVYCGEERVNVLTLMYDHELCLLTNLGV